MRGEGYLGVRGGIGVEQSCIFTTSAIQLFSLSVHYGVVLEDYLVGDLGFLLFTAAVMYNEP